MKNIALVTGAEGFYRLASRELFAGERLECNRSYLPDHHTSLPNLPRVDFVQCDLRNGQRVTQLLDTYRPTHIFHLGAQSLPIVLGESSRDF